MFDDWVSGKVFDDFLSGKVWMTWYLVRCLTTWCLERSRLMGICWRLFSFETFVTFGFVL